jgi:hypothetical protein
MLLSLRRVLAWTFAVGGVAFTAGFFGPMILAPGANQGPLLGIFITGPLGLMVGLALGVGREMLGYQASPLDLMAGFGDQGLRLAATAGGAILAFYGLSGLRRGEGRPAAASIVVGVVLLWYGMAGRFPAWFRR